MIGLASNRVSPFGNPGINACVPLPLAFRSLPRPSSPPCAQASPTCLHSLDYKVSVTKQSAYDLTCVTSNNLSDNLRTDSLSIRILKSAIYHYFRCQIAMTLGQLGCPRTRRRSKRKLGLGMDARGERLTELSARSIRRACALGTSRRLRVGRPTRVSVKEVIQPQVPLRLPCYDFAPVTALAFGRLPPCGLRHGLRALTASMA